MSVTIKRKNPGGIDSAVKKLNALKNKEIAVGFPKGKARAYPDGTSLVFVAASHVFGIGVPQRDFMALAKPDVIKKTSRIIKRIAKAKTSGEVQALQESAGLTAQSSIQQAITDLSEPPNSPATIARKGSSNPLIDTAHMVNSVTYVVRDKTK